MENHSEYPVSPEKGRTRLLRQGTTLSITCATALSVTPWSHLINLRTTRQPPDMTIPYAPETESRSDIDQLQGAVVVDFGTNWCGHCQRVQPLVDAVFASHAEVRHFKIEDGSGRPLGRSFSVRLWPTLIFLRDGVELARLIRPGEATAIADALALIVVKTRS